MQDSGAQAYFGSCNNKRMENRGSLSATGWKRLAGTVPIVRSGSLTCRYLTCRELQSRQVRLRNGPSPTPAKLDGQKQ